MQPTNQTTFMFKADFCGGWHRIENSVAPLKKNKANIGFTNHRIATSKPLLLVDCVEIISNDKVCHSPNIGSGSAAVILGNDLINKTGIAVLVYLQRRGFDSIRPFVEADPWTHGEPSLFRHFCHGILHGEQLKEIDYGYDDRHKQSNHCYFIPMQFANPLADVWHVTFLWLGAQCLFWFGLSYGVARLIVFYGGGHPILVLLALALLFVFTFQFVRSLLAFDKNPKLKTTTKRGQKKMVFWVRFNLR